MEMRDLHWSPAEKRVARRAHDKALQSEKEALIRKVKDRAAKIRDVKDVWDLHCWMGKRGKEIDQKYDYRYSVLPVVFGRLIRERDIQWEDLDSLDEDKMSLIRRAAAL